jgi:hypothetical protein
MHGTGENNIRGSGRGLLSTKNKAGKMIKKRVFNQKREGLMGIP